MLLTIVLTVFREVRLYRHARRADSMLCPQCLYPLDGESGVCPECGEPFTAPDLRHKWSEAARREPTWRV